MMTLQDDIRDLHSELRIYEACEHQHTPIGSTLAGIDVYDDGVVELDDGSVTCDDAYACSICRECCTRGNGEQSEVCADGHRHTGRMCWPCPTRRLADSAEVPV